MSCILQHATMRAVWVRGQGLRGEHGALDLHRAIGRERRAVPAHSRGHHAVEEIHAAAKFGLPSKVEFSAASTSAPDASKASSPSMAMILSGSANDTLLRANHWPY